MIKQTLLDMTQEILSSLGSDEVNSISDTTESMQVAHIIKRKYYDIVSRGDLPELSELFQLLPSLDGSSPVLMYIPDNVTEMSWLKYFDSNATNTNGGGSSIHDTNLDLGNNSVSPGQTTPPGYKYVTVLPIRQFIDQVNQFNPSESIVESFTFKDVTLDDSNSFTFYYKTDRTPRYCCIISNFYVIFDSYDASQDSTLQASKTMAFGEITPEFKMEDNFIPDIHDGQFPLLLNEAKSLAYFELKQTAHPKADQEIKRQWSQVQKNKSVMNRPTYFDELANFGRQGNQSYSGIFRNRGWRER